MTTHAELVEAVAALIEPHIIADNAESLSASILALIAEGLREPSEEMKRAAPTSYPITVWEAMLADSPLYPPKDGNEE